MQCYHLKTQIQHESRVLKIQIIISVQEDPYNMETFWVGFFGISIMM